MKWNKQSVILVAVIFAISYVYNLKYEHDMSHKIKTQKISACKQQMRNDCDDIEIYHDLCFGNSYRSQFKAMHFFNNEYDTCIKKQRLR